MKTLINIINFLSMPIGILLIGLYIYWFFYTNVLDGESTFDWWYLHIGAAIPCLGFGPASIIWWFNNRNNIRQDREDNNPFA